eukprot:c25238_g1_i1.p1 GENE.c25238_g1_i1~~c25238_g1_i1.p1  ORF type:complete len:199 (+),score=34.98 c25238_g1_i1:34-630(+)
MDTLIGLKGKDFVIVASDTTNARSVLRFKSDADKVMELDSHKLMGFGGDTGDYLNFCEFIQRNVALSKFRTGMTMSTNAAVHFTRGELARALRKGPKMVNLLVGGYDEHEGASLYYLDYLGSLQKLNIAAHGYAANFCFGLLDRYWHDGITQQEGLEIIAKCLHEMRTRFLLSTPAFSVKIVDANGVRTADISALVAH